jgi:hypothetical protein
VRRPSSAIRSVAVERRERLHDVERREVLGFAALLAAGVGMSGCCVPDESRPLVEW